MERKTKKRAQRVAPTGTKQRSRVASAAQLGKDEAGLVAATLRAHGLESASPMPSAWPSSFGVWLSYRDALRLGQLLGARAQTTARAKRTRKSPGVPEVEWSEYIARMGVVRHAGQVLTVHIPPPGHHAGKWLVLALTAPPEAMRSAQGILDNHAHELLGEFGSQELAYRAIDKYVRAWARKVETQGASTEPVLLGSDRCDCGEIGEKPFR